MRRLYLFLLIFTFSIHAIASEIYNEQKTAIVVKSTDPVFIIRLQSNPTTGYSWFLRQYDSQLIEPVNHTFQPSTDKQRIGAPGYETWTFRVKPAGFTVPQKTEIHFVYIRPWEKIVNEQPLVFQVNTD